MAEVKPHTRINDILLGPLERPALQWLAARMPGWVTPDMLTGLGFFASILIFASYALTNLHAGYLWLASFGFILNWFGDSLDGTLARFRKIERPQYGYFIDHTTDAAAVTLILLGLGLSPYMKFNLAALVLVGYLLVSIMVYITTYVNGIFRVSYARLGPTEVRMIGILANTVVFFLGRPVISLPSPLGDVAFYDLVAIVLAAAFYVIYGVVVLQQCVQLNKIDRAKLVAKAEKSPRAVKAGRSRRKRHVRQMGNVEMDLGQTSEPQGD